MKSVVAVVEISYSVVQNVTAFNDDSEGNAEAEKVFLEKCSEHIWNFDEYTEDDKDVLIEQGYECYGSGNSICITHIEIPEY